MSDQNARPSLSDQDCEALDWVLANGIGADDVPERIRPRVAQVESIFIAAGAIDISPSNGRIHAVLAAIDSLSLIPELCEDDQDAVDALVLAGLDPSRVPGALRPRADVLHEIGGLVQSGDLEYDAALTDRVMAFVDDSVVPVEPDRPVLARIGGRLSDFVSVAAVILIAASVVWPVLSTYRQSAIKHANQANLAVAGIGFGSYAADFQGVLPQVRQDDARSRWWNVRSDVSESNAANLFALARFQYTPEGALSSPGNPDAPREPLPAGALDWQHVEQVSYSIALPSGDRQTVAGPRVILADRSPVVLRLLNGEAIRIDENSPNHSGQGQHMLKGDGTVIWTTEPYTEYGDHVFLPRTIERPINSLSRQLKLPIHRVPAPSDRADVFLGP